MLSGKIRNSFEVNQESGSDNVRKLMKIARKSEREQENREN